MKKYPSLVFILLFAFQISSIAQDSLITQGFKIGITPSALINRWIGIQGKVSYTYRQFELEANAGYLFGKDNDEPYTGYRIRSVLKYHFYIRDHISYYFGFGGLLRKLNIDAHGTFRRFNNAFFQELDFKISQRMIGYYGMLGQIFTLKKDIFFVDIGLGIGRSKIYTEHSNIPEDAELIYALSVDIYDSRSAGTIDYPVFFGHFSLLYRF